MYHREEEEKTKNILLTNHDGGHMNEGDKGGMPQTPAAPEEGEKEMGEEEAGGGKKEGGK